MRFNLEQLKSRLDMFALGPNLRVSQNSDKLATPPGLISTIVVIILSIMFFTNKFTILEGQLSVTFTQMIMSNFHVGEESWNFVPGTKDQETNFDFLLAFGVYNASDFKPPTQVERLG